jgi:hypothetical protein
MIWLRDQVWRRILSSSLIIGLRSWRLSWRRNRGRVLLAVIRVYDPVRFRKEEVIYQNSNLEARLVNFKIRDNWKRILQN